MILDKMVLKGYHGGIVMPPAQKSVSFASETSLYQNTAKDDFLETLNRKCMRNVIKLHRGVF